MEAFILAGSLVAAVVVLIAWSGPNLSAGMIAVCCVISLLILRPGVVGEYLGPAGAVIFLALLAFTLRRPKGPPIPGHQFLSLGLAMVYLVLVGGQDLAPSTVSGLLVTPVIALAGAAIGRRPDVCRLLVSVAALIAVQQSVALVLTQLLGLETWTFESSSRVRFGWDFTLSPLGSVTTGSGGVLTIFPHRLTGPFGEPGVLACVMACFGALSLVVERQVRWWVQVSFLVCIALTQSIAGLGVYAMSIVSFVALRRQAHRQFRLQHFVGTLVAVGVATWAATRPDGLLRVKAEANAASVADRLGSASLPGLFRAWVESPLGTSDGLGINLLQSSIRAGFVALVVLLWMYMAPLRGSGGYRVFPFVVALLGTVVFAQPPMLYTWVFFAFLAGGLAAHPDAYEPEVIRSRPIQGATLRAQRKDVPDRQ